MKRVVCCPAAGPACLLMRPAPAAADLTVFWGFSPTPASRSARGFAVGVSLLIVGFEFEYGNTADDRRRSGARSEDRMFNGLIQTPTSSRSST